MYVCMYLWVNPSRIDNKKRRDGSLPVQTSSAIGRTPLTTPRHKDPVFPELECRDNREFAFGWNDRRLP